MGGEIGDEVLFTKEEMMAHVPTDAKARKAIPLFSGLLRYFPDALIAVADLSRVGNEQHNPGQPLHWAKEKSTDEHDALVRHILDAGTRDSDGVRHSAKVAWRALAALQREIEADRGQPGQVDPKLLVEKAPREQMDPVPFEFKPWSGGKQADASLGPDPKPREDNTRWDR